MKILIQCRRESELTRAQQIKLLTNHIYGIFSSNIHKTGNVIYANNITAACRTEIWLASKVLDGIVTSTDGLVYTRQTIISWNENQNVSRKPGLQSFSNRKKVEKHKQIECWKINKFWSHYDIELKRKITHKIQGQKIVLLNNRTVDYVISTDNKCVIKVRSIPKEIRTNNLFLKKLEMFFQEGNLGFLYDPDFIPYRIISKYTLKDYANDSSKLPGMEIAIIENFYLSSYLNQQEEEEKEQE